MKHSTVTIFTANYYPEDTAIGLYTTQFAKDLVKKGYEVSIITGFPYYPQWKIKAEYAHRPDFYIEEIDGCKIVRYKQFVPEKVTFGGRIRLMMSLVYGSMRNYRKIPSSDIVFCIVPFTFSILPAWLLARKNKAKLWIHIQDFEFDLAMETGILKDNVFTLPLKKSLFSVERFLLNRASVVSSISYRMLAKIKEKSCAKEVVYFPNWVSANNINPENFRRHRYLNPDKFTLLYSGNIGEKQDWATFTQLCSAVSDPEIEIVIVGDGGYLPTLKTAVEKYPFVKFFPVVDYEELSDLLCSADLHLLFQKTDVIDTIMPSKLLGMMASARPSLITGNRESEVATILEKSQGGIYFNQADPQKLYRAVLEFKNHPQKALITGEKARKYILDAFSEDVVLNTITQKIDEHIHSK